MLVFFYGFIKIFRGRCGVFRWACFTGVGRSFVCFGDVRVEGGWRWMVSVVEFYKDVCG